MPHRLEARERRLDIIDMPEQDRPAPAGRHRGRRIAAVDDAELVLDVADADLDLGRRFAVWHLEICVGAEQLGVSVARRAHIIGEEVDRGHAAQKDTADPDWADIAYALGYTSQQHFITNFKTMLGSTTVP